MITNREEYANCKAQVERQQEELATLQAVIAQVQAEIDAVASLYEVEQ